MKLLEKKESMEIIILVKFKMDKKLESDGLVIEKPSKILGDKKSKNLVKMKIKEVTLRKSTKRSRH